MKSVATIAAAEPNATFALYFVQPLLSVDCISIELRVHIIEFANHAIRIDVTRWIQRYKNIFIKGLL